MADEQPIPYWSEREPVLPAPVAGPQGAFGVASVWCFGLFALTLLAGLGPILLDIGRKYVPWSGPEAGLAAACAGVVLVPLGAMCGFIGLTYPPAQRIAAIIGLVLNGSTILVFFVLRSR
ncbi:MAG: hypothetical protein JWO31_3915 [Phycisphaerales bacterium]|nr:hypothetical protein [Phycisphaerales bacterium]